MTLSHNCETSRERFSEYLDGDLSGDEKQKLETEIADCTTCRSELDELRRTLGRIGSIKHHAPPAFVDSVRSQIRQRSQGRFFKRKYLLFGRIPFEWVSFVMILAMLVYYIVIMRSTPTDVAPAP